MTKEEMEEIIKLNNASRPQITQTFNFNAPVGQQIAHVDKIEAHFDKDMNMQILNAEEIGNPTEIKPREPEGTTVADLFHFIHPSIIDEKDRIQIHREIQNLVRNNSIPNICAYLNEMAREKRILLPIESKIAQAELQRMGMPGEDVEGFSIKNLQKYYRK